MSDNINRIIDDLIKNYKTKKFKDALVQADILTKHKIKNKQINFICGELFLSFRLYKKALFSLAYSIKLDPKFYAAYKLLGITEYSLGNFNKALKIYNVAKKLNTIDADLFFNIAKCYGDLGKYNLSIKNYIESLKLDPNNKETKISLIKSLTFFKPKDNLDNEIIKLDLSLYNLTLPFSFYNFEINEPKKLITQNELIKKEEKEIKLTEKKIKLKSDEKYYALVIGNNKYEHLEKLDAAENDALVIANVLEKKYGFDVNLLLNADYDTTVNSLFKITNKLKKNDNLLIYYAGHGELDKAENRG